MNTLKGASMIFRGNKLSWMSDFERFCANKLSRITNFEKFRGINFCCDFGKKLRNRETFFPRKFLPLKYTVVFCAVVRKNLRNHETFFPWNFLPLKYTVVFCAVVRIPSHENNIPSQQKPSQSQQNNARAKAKWPLLQRYSADFEQAFAHCIILNVALYNIIFRSLEHIFYLLAEMWAQHIT